jgi:Dolichyl-phosphate-mannose-protein mannosyltransferase
VKRLARWFVAGGFPRWIISAAFLLIVVLYFKNDDMGGDPKTPRGDGVYRPVLARGDGHMLYLIARSTALDLDWNFQNDLKFGDPWVQPTDPDTGRRVIPQPVGPALVWTPMIWLAQGTSKVLNLFGADIPSHGYTKFHQRFVFLSSALGACLAIALGMLVARRLFAGRWSAMYAGLAGLLATPLTYYATHMPSYNHALDALASSAFLAYWVLTIGRSDWKRWILLGVLLGLAMLIRMQELALGVVVAFEVVTILVRKRDLRVLAGGAIVLAIALVMFTPQLAFWKIIYGGWFDAPQGAAYTRPGHPMILELLWSARNGWFSSHPVAYAGCVGLFFVPKQARYATAGLVLALVVQIYLNSTIFDYWGQTSFGARRLCGMTLPIVVGFAALAWRCGRLMRRWRPSRRRPYLGHALAVLVLLPFVAWNLDRVFVFKKGRPAPDGLSPTCCSRMPDWAEPSLQWVYNRVGNPFQFPASAWFALRHDVEIQRWDRSVGNYAVMPNFEQLSTGKLVGVGGRWRAGYPGSEPYLVGRFSGPRENERWFRWTLDRRVRVIVPNIVPNDQHVAVVLAPAGARHVKLSWNDQVVFDGDLHDGWNTIGFTLYQPEVGEHELAIESELAPYDPKLPPVGVAIHTIDLRVIK